MSKLIEIVRSFSFKLNVGNFESRDFFCSRKCECEEGEADKKSAELAMWCEKEIMKSVSAYQSQNMPIVSQQKAFIADLPPEAEADRAEAQEKEVKGLPVIEV